jgi:MFS family permease
LASLPNKKRGLLLLVSALIIGLSLTGFAFSSSWPLSLGLIVIVGLGTTGRMTLGNTLIQYYVDNEYRGRVMSIYMMEFGLTSFGTFAAGLMADTAIGVQWTVGGFAMVLIAISMAALVFAKRLRRLD